LWKICKDGDASEPVFRLYEGIDRRIRGFSAQPVSLPERTPVKRVARWQGELESVLTISEVAEILRVHPATVYRVVRRGELPGFKIGNSWRINKASLDLWLLAERPQRLSSRT
jgi:excisionase family DNA binding protein